MCLQGDCQCSCLTCAKRRALQPNPRLDMEHFADLLSKPGLVLLQSDDRTREERDRWMRSFLID